MCIAVLKNTGVEMPGETVLKECYDTNPQGAGFAHFDPDTEMWIARKGFMTWMNFWTALQHMKYQTEDAVMMHFRISTSGKKSHPDCTHPFPISFDKDDLNAHDFETENIVMHNGVVGPGDGDLSDTQVAILKYLAPLFPFIEEPGVDSIIGDLLKDASCRWLLARKEDIMLYGKWHDGEEHAPGVLFSNKGYLPAAAYNRHQSQRAGGVWNRERGYGGYPGAGGYPEVGPTQGSGKTGGKDIGPIYNRGRPPAVYDKTILVDLGAGEKRSTYLSVEGWDWKKWDDDFNYTSMLERIEEENENKVTEFPSMLIDAPSLVEVFDLHGELDAVIDEEGNIMWNDGEWVEVSQVTPAELPIETKKQILIHGIDFLFECPVCGNNLSVRKLNIHGECCFCFNTVMDFNGLIEIESKHSMKTEKEEDSNSNVVRCPNCEEHRRLVDSPFSIGEVLCEICGAVFGFTGGAVDVVMFDYDIAKSYKMAQTVIGVR